tara:strand:+ start:8265 stop:9815 length:1551 start_codon:yes stop_codon:yes gene_type:complete
VIIGILKEVIESENRVAITPAVVTKILKLGYEVQIEKSAGVRANYTDNSYEHVGAKIVNSPADIWNHSDIVIKINPPSNGRYDEFSKFNSNTTLISFFYPRQNDEHLKSLAKDNVNILAMDCVPRITRAQKMDALSSMSNVAGSRAVIEASHLFGRFFGGQITAAGKISPAKVLVIGAGVAGLSAIGAAASLGAIVRAFDTRPEVKEQVESLSAEFLTVDMKEDGTGKGGYAKVMSDEYIAAEHKLFEEQCKDVDIIITTALIPGKKAPILLTENMISLMKPGSVIVDLAAERGGNCCYTKRDQVVNKKGVNIVGYTDLPSRLPSQSSQLYATNVYHLLSDLTPEKNGKININMKDEVIRGMTIIKEGEITFPPPVTKISTKTETPKLENIKQQKISIPIKSTKKRFPTLKFGLALLALIGIGSVSPPSFMAHFTVFVLGCFVGYMVVWNVTSALHTPLMSVTNAVSSIIIIGALIQISSENIILTIMASLAIFITSINIVGGFAVTKRMLEMFKK